jgi:HEAT repeat protein
MAMSALAKLGDESIVPKLLDLSHDWYDRVRRAALQTFADLGKGQENVVDRLLESLGDQEKVERLTAIEVLSQRKDAAAIEPLQGLGQHRIPAGSCACSPHTAGVDANFEEIAAPSLVQG